MVRKTKKGEVTFRPGSEILSKKIIRKGKKKEGTIYEVIETPRKARRYRITIRGPNGKLREVEMTRAQLKAYEKELERAAGKGIEAPEKIKEKPLPEEKAFPPIVLTEKPGEPKLKMPTLYMVKEELERKLGKEAVAKMPYKRLATYARAVKEFREEGEKAKKEEKEKIVKAKKGWSVMTARPSEIDPGMVVKVAIIVIALVLILSMLAWVSSLF